MKTLFAMVPATAHLYPAVPLAGALIGAGHQVRVATPPELVDTVTGAGLTCVPIGEEGLLAGIAEETEAGTTLLTALGDALQDTSPPWHARKPLPPRPLLSAFMKFFTVPPSAPTGTTSMDDLVAFARSWRPDLVIWDPMFFPGAVAARASGAAHARFLWSVDDIGWTREQLRLTGVESGSSSDPMAERMRASLGRFGLEFSEDLLVGQWSIDPMPTRMRLPVDLRYVPVRSVPFTGSAALPKWLWEAPQRPRVALSAGVSMRKSFAGAGRFPLSGLVEAMSGLDIEVVATLDDSQLADVGTVPDNVRVIEYVPLDLLLPTCSAVVHHGGGRTFAAAVAHQVPQLVCAEDGPHVTDIGRYIAEQGAGLVIDNDPFDVDTVRKQLVDILDDPSFLDGVRSLRQDMLATPSPHDIVPVLERLTAEHRT
ncbi:nucleotide disphospho-sugar-binding domain-containing protein [Streptomyces sp. NPDC050439]|uniref:nucleotide disphospho-sugar-binding domain-containing protein n=1 Tax=unclassified Streptomyces TaxID=2593676 RepID=UPI00341B4638